MGTHKMRTNQSLTRGLAILDALDGEGGELGVREIARRLSISPTIVQRLLRALADAHYVVQDETSQKYRIGYRALSLGASLLTEDKLVSIAMPLLKHLSDQHHLNAYLAVISGGALTYVLTQQSAGPISIRSEPGTKAAFHSTAIGKAILAHEDEQTVLDYIGSEPLSALTDETITDPVEFSRQLKRTRQQGYALAINENLPGVTSVGARIRNAAGKPVASVSVAYAPTLQPTCHLPEIVRLVTETAAAISKGLGCPESLIDRATPMKADTGNAA